MPDEKISIELEATLKAQSILDGADAAIKRIRQIQEELTALSAKGKASLDIIAREMKKAFAEQAKTGILKPSEISKPDTLLMDKASRAAATAAYKEQIQMAREANQAANASIKEYNALVNAALAQEKAKRKEVTDEVAKQEKLKTQIAKEAIDERIKSEEKLTSTLKTLEKQKTDEAIKSSKQRADEDRKNAKMVLEEQKRIASESAAKAFTKEMISPGAIAGAEQLRTRLDAIKVALTNISKEGNVSIKDAGRLLLEAAEKAGVAGEQLRKFKSDVASATSEMSKSKFSINNIAAALTRLGIVVSIGQAFRALAGFIKDATQSALEFTKAVYGMQIGVRALQRAGTDITIADVTENIERLREEWGIFSEKELVEGTAQLLNLVRSFGFAKEQIFELQDAISTLAIVNGRAMDDVQRTVALAISSGYTEGLQRLGVSINRVTIAEKAATLGWKGGYTALTEQQRAYATYLTILEKTALYSDDAKKAQDELFGSVQKSKAIWADLKKEIGNAFLPIYAKVIETLVSGAKALWTAMKIVALVVAGNLSNIAAAFTFVMNVAKQAWDIISGKGIKLDIDGAFLAAQEVYRKSMKEFGDRIAGEELPNLGDTDKAKKNMTDFTEDQLDAYENMFEELLDMQDEYGERAQELQEEFQQDMLEIDQEYAEKRADIWKDYYEEVAKINQDAQESIDDENADFADSIAEANADAQKQTADANRKYRESEIKAERDYQEKLRRLREEFLFDLEDALRARDALQVLRLIRRYNLDKEQLGREKNLDKQERAESHRQEIEDIRRQANERIKELQIEHQKRLAEIEEQKQKELAEAAKQREEELVQAREDWEEAREERIKQHEQDIEDLKKWLEEQLKSVTENFIKTEGVTESMSNSVASIIKKVFGRGGLADKSFKEFSAMIDSVVAKAKARKAELDGLLKEINAMSAQLNASAGSGTGYTPPTEPLGYSSHATGLKPTLVTRPHLFMAGEGSIPEIVTITPTNKINQGEMSGNGGKGTLEIMLGSGLEGRIVDNALGQVDIILRRELSKK